MIAMSPATLVVRAAARALAFATLLCLPAGCARDEQPAREEQPGSDAPPASAAVDTLPMSDSHADPFTLSAYGYGPVRVGMTVEDARAALGGRLSVPNAAEGECTYVRSEGTPEGVIFMVVEGTVKRVDVRTPAVAVRTDAGVHIGEKEARVKELYADRVTVQPHKYSDGHYLIIAPDSLARLVFETDGDTVSMMRGGMLPMALWVEGCS
jgi:hypothetical protein